jgi:hypothetical protein
VRPNYLFTGMTKKRSEATLNVQDGRWNSLLKVR